MTTPDLDAWYRAYGEAVFRRGMRFFGDESAAWDLVQETFLRAEKYRASYRGGSPLSWLLTIADRTALTQLQKNGSQTNVSLDEVSSVLADEAGERHASVTRDRTIKSLLSRCDERTALIVVRRYLDEMGLNDIAAELDINEKTVRRTIAAFLDQARRWQTEAAQATNTQHTGGAHG